MGIKITVAEYDNVFLVFGMQKCYKSGIWSRILSRGSEGDKCSDDGYEG